MKKAITILVLGIFLFNLAGYRVAFYFASRHADARIQEQLDNEGYNDNELVVLKMPMSVPYYSGTAGFEYTRGEVTLDGVIYRYVKKRCVNDTLEMYCIPHMQKMELLSARDRFVKLSADYVQPAAEQKSNTPVKTAVKPFSFDGFEQISIAWPEPRLVCTTFGAVQKSRPLSPFTSIQPHPPQMRFAFPIA